MPNITWCDLPEDVSLWPGLPLSLSGDEVMPLDYHAAHGLRAWPMKRNWMSPRWGKSRTCARRVCW